MKLTHKYSLIGLLLGLSVFIIVLVFFGSIPGKTLELKGLDYLFYLRGTVPPNENIIIIAIDDISFSELKLPWPWPRGLHAQLINNLRAARAKIIVFDILFAEPSSEEEDISFAQAIKDAGNVVLSSEIDVVSESGYKQITEVAPLQIFRDAAAGVGACTLVYDYDNIIRRGRLKFGRIKSLAYEAIRLDDTQTAQLLDMLNESILINYIGPSRSVKTISYYQALNYKDYLPSDIFRNKIVLVGRALAASPEPQAKQPDVFLIPRFPNSAARMAGVEIIANFIDTILRDRFINELPKRYIYLILLLILVFLSIIEIRSGYVINLILAVLCAILYGGIAYFCFSYLNILLPVFMPIAGIWLVFGFCNFAKYFISEQEKKYIKNVLQKYVPPALVKKILEAPEKLKLGGDEIVGTVLFSDLERFTSVSEKFEPEKLVKFINEYLSEMSEIIFKYNGTITRFIGDAILAIWGAPVKQDDHALRAVNCAIEMTNRLKELNIEWKFRGLPELKIRIGINTGKMVVGNVGSKKHMDYTAMGDSVNLAARLEEANKIYGTSIIAGHSTFELINKVIECKRLDIITVRGREESVEIYEPVRKK